jgi:acyl carrier protein
VQQLEESVRRRIAEILRQPLEKVADGTELIDLVAESFVLVEMVIELQEEFHVRLLQEDLNGVRTVADLTRLVASRARADG